ncbi:MAG: fatty acid desaturase [Candidatus Moranbacteria bacterium]|nr:fatty acid desaturase [Candidatus Moranbacteria bacterium]
MTDFSFAVHDAVVTWLAQGIWNPPGWVIVLYTLGMTHITIAAVTIYLHRCQAHSALALRAFPAHFFRLWLWLTTGMITKEWVAIHRKHHAKCETIDDPHSPMIHGIWKVLSQGADLYRDAVRRMWTTEVMERGVKVLEIHRYSHMTPNDWVERHLYTRYPWQGVGLMLIIDLVLFGAIGATVWAVQMVWIPFMAAGVINGAGHYWGYRNFPKTATNSSTNISPWGIIIGGEELHNNHHGYPISARFSVRPGEFDIGWAYIGALEKLGLAKVKTDKLAPRM